MPIETRHPAFQALDENVKKMRAVMAGEDAVKKAGVKYLPKISPEQSDDDYKAYKERADFFGACVRTKEALAGAICRRPLVLHGPEEWVKKYADDATTTGLSLNRFAGELVHEMLTTSRVGVLVEYSEDLKRPFLTHYIHENITNHLPNGDWVLRETAYQQDSADPYVLTLHTSYRELRWLEGRPFVRVWASPVSGATLEAGEDQALVYRGQPLKELPFVLASMDGIPLLPLAQANISHYRTSADLENALHWGAVFTPWISANIPRNPDGTIPDFPVGGSTVWVFDPGANCGMLEIQGNALTALENRLQGKQQLMAAIGARLLIEAKKAAETEATTRINASGEGATLTLTVDAVEAALTKAVRMMAAWDGIAATDDIRVEMNRDFVDSRLTAQDITAYLSLYVSGALDLETFLMILQGGEVLPDGRTPSDIKALLDTQEPPMAAKDRTANQDGGQN